MIIVSEAEPHSAGVALWVHVAPALAALAVTVAAMAVESCSHVEHAVVIEHEPGTCIGITQFNLGFYLIAVFAGNEHERRGIARERALGQNTDAVRNLLDALGFIGTVELPGAPSNSPEGGEY